MATTNNHKQPQTTTINLNYIGSRWYHIKHPKRNIALAPLDLGNPADPLQTSSSLWSGRPKLRPNLARQALFKADTMGIPPLKGEYHGECDASGEFFQDFSLPPLFQSWLFHHILTPLGCVMLCMPPRWMGLAFWHRQMGEHDIMNPPGSGPSFWPKDPSATCVGVAHGNHRPFKVTGPRHLRWEVPLWTSQDVWDRKVHVSTWLTIYNWTTNV